MIRSWQDWLLGAGGIVLSASLVPALLDAQKPPLVTSLVVAGVLVSFVVAEWALLLRFSAVVCAVQAAAWLVLALQRTIQ